MKYLKYLGLVLVITLVGCKPIDFDKEMKITINKDTKEIQNYLSLIDPINFIEYDIENLDVKAKQIQYRVMVIKDGKIINGANDEFTSGDMIDKDNHTKLLSGIVVKEDNQLKIINSSSSGIYDDFKGIDNYNGYTQCKIETDKEIKLNEEIPLMAIQFARTDGSPLNSLECSDFASLKKLKNIIIVTMRITDKKI